jgi:hypothetical protein
MFQNVAALQMLIRVNTSENSGGIYNRLWG